MTTSIIGSSLPAIQQPTGFYSLAAAASAPNAPVCPDNISGNVNFASDIQQIALLIDMIQSGGGVNACAIRVGSTATAGVELSLVNPGTGLTVTVRKGWALIGGGKCLEADSTLALPDNTSRVWIWFQQTGALTYTTSTTPPSTLSCLIGSAVTSGGNITSLDTSGVLYLKGSNLYRQTGDNGMPSDSPPASLILHTATAFGIYEWNGVSHRQIGTPSVTADPTSAYDGMQWYRSDLLQMYVWFSGAAHVVGVGGAPTGAAGGDLAGTYPSPTLAPAGPGVTGPTGDGTHVPVITIDAKGRVTALSSTAITAGGSGTVTSVALAAPGIYSVSGSPVTSTGTLTLALAVQAANQVWCGPASGSAATPTFRSLVTADFPASGVTAGTYTNATVVVDATGRVTAASSGTGGGTVTSVALTLPTGLSVTGSPVTGSGTLAVTEDNQSANTFKAGPTTGSAATPAYRAQVPADIPALDAAKITTGVFAIARLATGTPTGSKFVRDDGTLAVPAGGSGTVTSVGLSGTADYSAGGGPITTSGTLTLTEATRSANTIKAGPTSGSAAVPTFRPIVADDLASGGTSSKFLRGDMSWQAFSAFLAAANNLSDVASAATARANIGANVYDIPFSIEAAPGASMVILRLVAVRAFTLPASLTGSQAKSGVNATVSTTFTLLKNGSSFATCAWSAAGSTGAYTAASSTSFAAGDVLTVTAPTVPDATLAQIAFCLVGTY